MRGLIFSSLTLVSLTTIANARCYQPRDSGPCYANIPRFYYNKFVRQCLPFTYGGCRGNSNNFERPWECEQTCIRSWFDCFLPRDSGPCYAYRERFFYNPFTQRCEMFIYGGCEGNKNNFEDPIDCENTCIGRRAGIR